MNALRRGPKTKNWIRFALKLGLLATDASVLAAIGRMLTERNDSREVLRPRERFSADLHARSGWSHGSTLFVGAALGVGLGMLFAPVSGEEARTAIRDQALNVRDKFSDAAAWASRLGPSSPYHRSTGTYAD
jgi:YtxH-like protein